MNDIFNPLITDILRLLDDQVKSANLKQGKDGMRVLSSAYQFHRVWSEGSLTSLSYSKGIFLVGGFGSSQLLKSKIQKKFPEIQVIQPADAWAAVVK